MATLRMVNGDCLEEMKGLPNKSVDLFICDLPYGCLSGRAIGATAEKKKVFSGAAMGCAWDVPIDLDAFWIQVKRLCRNDHTPVLMFCSTKFGFDLYNSNPGWFRYDIVWSKTNAVGFLSANKMPMRSHEMIYVFSKKGANYERIDIEGDFPAGGGGRSAANFLPIAGMPNLSAKVAAGRRCVKSVVEVANKKIKGGHPTQKPAELYDWLIKRYSKEGDTVLDPTAGSFTSVFTAHGLGRNAIGIEKSETFYQKACEQNGQRNL